MARAAKRVDPDQMLSLFSQANQESLLQPVPPPTAVTSPMPAPPQAPPPVEPRVEKLTLIETPNAEKLTIALTGRAPITIDKADWPIIARSKIDWTEDAHQKKFRLVVRQHADRRAIVYGIYEYQTTYAGDQPRSERGGEYPRTPATSRMQSHASATGYQNNRTPKATTRSGKTSSTRR